MLTTATRVRVAQNRGNYDALGHWSYGSLWDTVVRRLVWGKLRTLALPMTPSYAYDIQTWEGL
jgi:hypothetical protein